MFRKLLERLETIVEPKIDTSQFVTHYTPALMYKETERPVVYTLEIHEETQLKDHVVVNNYSQELHLELLYKGSKGDYSFKIKTENSHLALDKALSQQGKLLEDLAKLTQDVELVVTKSGGIKSTNYEVLLKKWQILKKELLRKHQGNQAQAYINGIDARMKNESLFLEELKQVKLFGLLFGGYLTLSEHDKPRLRKISNAIKFLPVIIEERVIALKEDKEKQERHITINGSMKDFTKEVQAKIQTYFKRFKVGSDPVFLSNYRQDIILNLETGYPKSVTFDMELINGRGYVQKKNINLRLKSNG